MALSVRAFAEGMTGMAGGSAGGPGGGGMGGQQNGGSQTASQISQWVAQNFTAKTVDGVTLYDLTEK